MLSQSSAEREQPFPWGGVGGRKCLQLPASPGHQTPQLMTSLWVKEVYCFFPLVNRFRKRLLPHPRPTS